MTDRAERELPEGFWYRFLEKIHHIIVIVDDFLCEELELSRKPKGKYADPAYLDRFTTRR